MKRCVLLGFAGIVWLTASQCASADMHIDRIDPADPTAGTPMELHGDFHAEQAPRSPMEVMLSKVVNRRVVEYRLPILQRSRSLMRVLVPATIPPGDDYSVIVRVPGRWLWTNTVRVQVRQPPPPARRGDPTRPDPPTVTTSGMFIEQVDPGEAFPGLVINIRGSHFGSHPGAKVVGINRGSVNQARVVSWSDQLVQAVLPSGLPPGDYRVLIYYDGTLGTSSNSVPLRVFAGGQDRAGAHPPPENAPPHYHRNAVPPPARRANASPPPSASDAPPPPAQRARR